jgi:hypothetical protein
VKWESREWNGKQGKENNCWKVDDSLRSFLFTLKNPYGVPPRKFALKAEKKQYAISCNSTYCAAFGYGCEIAVKDNYNANRNSFTRIGTDWKNRVETQIGSRWIESAYANDTAFEYFLTGAYKFTVKEIEVFEIAD